jgi:hypothetical protein
MHDQNLGISAQLDDIEIKRKKNRNAKINRKSKFKLPLCMCNVLNLGEGVERGILGLSSAQ